MSLDCLANKKRSFYTPLFLFTTFYFSGSEIVICRSLSCCSLRSLRSLPSFGLAETRAHYFSTSVHFRCKSSNWLWSTALGHSSIGDIARLFFGKAITSWMLSSWHMSMIRRSSPGAIPPCGGAPNLNACTKNPNAFSARSRL